MHEDELGGPVDMALRVGEAGPLERRRAAVRARVAAVRFIVGSAIFAVIVAAGCGFAAFAAARVSDAHDAEIHRTALREAVADYRGLLDVHSERFLRLLERSSGIETLRFEADLADDHGEAQPVIGRDGRIAGVLTWQPATPMTDLVRHGMPVMIVIAFALFGLAGFALHQLRRSRTQLALSEARARTAAEQDPLTGLPNRAKMAALVERAVEACRGDDAVAYGLMGLSRVDAVVSAYGQGSADEILQATARRLRDSLPDGASCGHVGPHELAVLMTGTTDAAMTMRAIIAAASQPHWLDTVVHVDVHAGLARAPADAATGDELMRRAELALRDAQTKAPGTLIAFAPALDAQASTSQFIRRELPRALGAGALDVHYQPIVAADGSGVTGVEALLRWTHRERGAIPPADFIPVAEQMGLMDALGAFVLRRALDDARRWPGLHVSVNLSPLQVRDRRFVDVVREALAQTGVTPSRLMLEITEGVLIDNPEQMIERIAELHAVGVKIALDDFGAGYSNLGYLQRFNFDKLKVDRSFVSALGESPNASVILQAIVTLGRALGVTVLVEGVETEEQRVLLRLAGCDEMQGFLFARPSPAEAIDGLIERRKAPGRPFTRFAA
jgi:diguanylate cyclase (GGDEF)-like protein